MGVHKYALPEPCAVAMGGRGSARVYEREDGGTGPENARRDQEKSATEEGDGG